MTKKLTLYEIINPLCKKGKQAVIRKKNHYMRIFSCKGIYYFSDSYWTGKNTVPRSFYIQDNQIAQADFDQLERDGWEYIEEYQPPLEQHEVGEKVWWEEEIYKIFSKNKTRQTLTLEPKYGQLVTDVAASAVTPYIPEIHDEKEEAPEAAITASEKLVTVCANCLRASCWQGQFYCDDYKVAGTVDMPLAVLEKKKLEHSDYCLD